MKDTNATIKIEIDERSGQPGCFVVVPGRLVGDPNSAAGQRIVEAQMIRIDVEAIRVANGRIGLDVRNVEFGPGARKAIGLDEG